MSALAVFLIAVGAGDIIRKTSSRTWPAVGAGPLTVVAVGALAGLWRLGDLALLGWAALVSAAWLHLGARADRTGTHHTRALAVFGVGIAVLFALWGWASPVGGLIAPWLNWVGLSDVEPDRAVLIVGVVLVQLVTANQLVRLLLGAVGTVRPEGEPQPSDRLKGGRLLGPMERLLIVGLGLCAELGLASAVVAAKGIIRFPELNAQRKEAPGTGIDEVTEYFLVGSFASWLVAMGGLALVLN